MPRLGSDSLILAEGAKVKIHMTTKQEKRKKKSKGQNQSTSDMPRIIMRNESDYDFTLSVVKGDVRKMFAPRELKIKHHNAKQE